MVLLQALVKDDSNFDYEQGLSENRKAEGRPGGGGGRGVPKADLQVK